jgi:hypothetical protein
MQVVSNSVVSRLRRDDSKLLEDNHLQAWKEDEALTWLIRVSNWNINYIEEAQDFVR